MANETRRMKPPARSVPIMFTPWLEHDEHEIRGQLALVHAKAIDQATLDFAAHSWTCCQCGAHYWRDGRPSCPVKCQLCGSTLFH